MCNYDVYRGRTLFGPRRPRKLRDLMRNERGDVEFVAASARLVEAVSALKK